MAIQFVSVRCPECGAELSIEGGRENAFCSYCGAKVLIHNENEHIYRNIDEARIKEAETERILRLKELELEEQERVRSRKSLAIAFGVALAFVVVSGVICIFKPMYGIWGVYIGILIALFAFLKMLNDKKKGNGAGTSAVTITSAMMNCRGKKYDTAVMILYTAGLTNIIPIPLHDLKLFSNGMNGLVDSISINGRSDFKEGDVFPADSEVMITYHSR